ncbi:helix-turn-helix transcriptional regulator [Promicromonospora thailandica]|uniref:Helix-turn-helix domain-containing protein n=1 Tax=Promicromonospora thailandica TaxID=765201 RepID=A0A9X2G9I1_9MICO|nr:helix-turn-helix transcriptional regulator [Promicromonospora thailandica]MCP2265061.1 Helix-turn-helix domain-containing protein [Promicromonospora thailandica]BFF19882.1 helix-turn-helix transcriptional regulator [Promicromonospora thailandica]
MTTTAPDPKALGAFLRERRGRVDPADVGLPEVGRRRTPGLRREEVAQLAGVGVTWYTWLEQGRAANPSDQVLGAVARALRLCHEERRYLMILAGRAADTGSGAPDPLMRVLPEHVMLLERMLPYPAAIQTAAYDLVATNRSYRYLFGDLDAVDPADRNCAWLLFTDDTWRAGLVEPEVVLRDLAGRLRAREAEFRGNPRWGGLLDSLREQSPEFVRYWAEHEVRGDRPGQLRRYRSPRVGRVDVILQSLWLDRGRGERIVVLLPADAASARRLEQLDSLVGAAPAWTARDGVVEALTG